MRAPWPIEYVVAPQAKATPTAENIRPAKKSLWLLIRIASPRWSKDGDCCGQVAVSPLWVSLTGRASAGQRGRGSEHFLERGEPFGHPQGAGQAQRPHPVGHGLAA